MVLMPGCVCCGGGTAGCGGYSSSDRMVVTLASLPHENRTNTYYQTLNPDQWEFGGDYLDSHNGLYVLYKQYSVDPTASAYSGKCVWLSYNGGGIGTTNATEGVSLQITLEYDYNGAGSSLRWRRTTRAWLCGGTIAWQDTGTAAMPSASKTYTNSNVIENLSSEWTYFYYWQRVGWTLTSSTCSIAEYDAGSHAAALKPCECFTPPTSFSTATDYKTTCLTYNGTSDPGTTNYRTVYAPSTVCSLADDRALFCNPVASTYLLGPAGVTSGTGTYFWGQYGTDELEVDLSDMVLGGSTYPTAGTYTLPWNGEYAGYSNGSLPCSSGGFFSGAVIGVNPSPPLSWGSGGYNSAGWGAGFNFSYSSVDYLLWVGVRLQRTIYNSSTPVVPTSRRLYVTAYVIKTISAGNLQGQAGLCATWQSDGSQGEDGYTCGNMPTVTGGSGVSGTRYLPSCTGTAATWSWEVRQA